MKECSCCGDPFCDEHNRHFFECACIGLSEEENIVSLSDTLAHRLPEPSEAVLDDILEDVREDMPWLSEAAVLRLKRINERAKEKGLGYKDCILTGRDKYLNLDASYYKGCDGKRGVILQGDKLRMLTPLEAERLQTLPEGCTEGGEQYPTPQDDWQWLDCRCDCTSSEKYCLTCRTQTGIIRTSKHTRHKQEERSWHTSPLK